MTWTPFVTCSNLLTISLFLLLAQIGQAKDYYLFAYFIEPAKSGVYYALSTDGYHWKSINQTQPILMPDHQGELMRDIFITRGPDHQFHAVWTWGWRTQTIGYSESPDLVHWAAHREIPLMAKMPGTVHTWAPEIYWDKHRKQWMMIWSSITGRETRNRIYCSYTRDFQSFTPPEVFFDPEYDVIDATILQARGRYYLIFKDQIRQPMHFQMRTASGPTLQGPWGNISETFTESLSEGPSALKIGRDYIVYYDHYRPPPQHYGAVRSTDLQHWAPITDQVSFPKNCKHGSFLKLTKKEADRLERLNTKAQSSTMP